MIIPDIKEIKEVMRITVKPGEQSAVIKREGEEFLIVVAVSGCGTINSFPEEDKSLRHLVSYNTAPRIDYRDGKEFVIKVMKEAKEPVEVVLLKMIY